MIDIKAALRNDNDVVPGELWQHKTDPQQLVRVTDVIKVPNETIIRWHCTNYHSTGQAPKELFLDMFYKVVVTKLD